MKVPSSEVFDVDLARAVNKVLEVSTRPITSATAVLVLAVAGSKFDESEVREYLNFLAGSTEVVEAARGMGGKVFAVDRANVPDGVELRELLPNDPCETCGQFAATHAGAGRQCHMCYVRYVTLDERRKP